MLISKQPTGKMKELIVDEKKYAIVDRQFGILDFRCEILDLEYKTL